MSNFAALPRIVTLHDIEIKPVEKSNFDNLTMELTAKTYRYLDDESGGGGGEQKAARKKVGSTT